MSEASSGVQMTIPHITIIGAGNMGGSLIGGLINNGHPHDKLCASDLDEKKLTFLREKFHIHTTTDNLAAIKTADVIIFAIKPQLFSHVATSLASLIEAKQPLIISIAAGIRTTQIEKWLGKQASIVRAMPNTPALIGCGATALYANRFVTEEKHEQAESILRAVGSVVWLKEEALMDTVTALSGSGPAYFFLMMESLEKAAEELGLPLKTAHLLTLETALGAARMAMESDLPLAELRRQVTSPGGTTEKAVSMLEENNIRGLFRKALQAAKIRSEELAHILEEEK